MMYEEFCQKLCERMQKEYPEYRITVEDFRKAQKSYRGLLVFDEKRSMGVSVDLSAFYKDYDTEKEEELVQKIRERIEAGWENVPEKNLVENLREYEWCRPRLRMMLLAHVHDPKLVHTMFLDMVAVYAVKLDDCRRTFVTDSLLESWGIEKEQLHADALEVTEREIPLTVINIKTVLSELAGCSPDIIPGEGPALFVAGFHKGTEDEGAIVMAYPGFGKEAAKIVGGSFYVLPSSIHEILLVRAEDTMPLDSLSNMVETINESEVEPEQRLSNSVYFYDADLDRIEIAAQGSPVE